MQLTKPFQGVPDGHIYPVDYQAGDECPPELEAAAIALGCADGDADQVAQASATDAPAPAKPGRKPKAQQ